MTLAIRAIAIAALLALGAVPLLVNLFSQSCSTCLLSVGALYGVVALLVSVLATVIAIVLATVAALRTRRWAWAALLPLLTIASALAEHWLGSASSGEFVNQMHMRYGWDEVSLRHIAYSLLLASYAPPSLLALAFTLRMPRRSSRDILV
ncbi:MAG TPA: hypothetical protein VF510_12410 [Ktedonobacterales bacterium]